jgi:Protein of unknown function (DUF2905)
MSRTLILPGLILGAVDLLWRWSGPLRLGRLPGDIVVERVPLDGPEKASPGHANAPRYCHAPRGRGRNWLRKKLMDDRMRELPSTSMIERQNLTMRMSMRRFTRLTNAFSKKLENLQAAVGLHFAHYNFVRLHSSLRMTPAMAAGIDARLWSPKLGHYPCMKHLEGCRAAWKGGSNCPCFKNSLNRPKPRGFSSSALGGRLGLRRETKKAALSGRLLKIS